MPARKPIVLPLLVKRDKRNGNKGKTIVSPNLSFNNVANALNRVEVFVFCILKLFIMV